MTTLSEYAARGREDFAAGRKDAGIYDRTDAEGATYRRAWQLARLASETPAPAVPLRVAAPPNPSLYPIEGSDAPPWELAPPPRPAAGALATMEREIPAPIAAPAARITPEDVKLAPGEKTPRKRKPATDEPQLDLFFMSAPEVYPPASPQKVVFVGQGPNATAWNHGLALGRSIVLNRTTFSQTSTARTAEEIAEGYCRKVAITGAIGSRLAALIDLDLHDFFTTYPRENLNARWNGKNGKGDKFDRGLGATTAELILRKEPYTHYVLLGAEVAHCFNVRADWLEERKSKNDEKGFWRHFLVFPHPSGISTWWNDDFNRFRARKRLREFLAIK